MTKARAAVAEAAADLRSFLEKTAQAMKTDRNLQIGLDYCTGTPVADLAEREKLATARIYQILNRLAFRFAYSHSITYVGKDRMIRAIRAAMTPRPPHVEPGTAQTPEEFYVEMNNEPRVRNL